MLTHQWLTGLAAIVTHMWTISLFGMHGIGKRGLFCITNMIFFVMNALPKGENLL